VTEKADWEKAWERDYPVYAKEANEPYGRHTYALSYDDGREAFQAGYLAAAERSPAVPGVVTREHRQAALLVVYPGTNKSPAEELWLLTGESSDSGGSSVQIFLPRVAQAIADAEARGASRVEELTAEACPDCGAECLPIKVNRVLELFGSSAPYVAAGRQCVSCGMQLFGADADSAASEAQYKLCCRALRRTEAEVERLKADFKQLAHLGNLARSRTTEEQDELSALLKKAGQR